ncbi:divergent PAP2 family protein [Paenibacillus chartarius]|uniref:Divergent PAP2 family protein n=1 Tax=Paenibacillus chartarius TaxID=747481 RepID=A0ABV6DHR1_9BACL
MSRALITGLTGIGLAQLAKLPMRFAEKRSLNWSELSGTGGMPSSHSAGAAALATYVAMKKGVCSIDFAISALFGLIVMYDAMGIRRSAGEMAVELNEMDAELERLNGRHPGLYHERRKEALKEKLGHEPEEVAAGALLGAATGLVSYWTETGTLQPCR